MKPFGREKIVTGGNKWKIDYHPHPKHKVENWWEGICGYLSRTEQKRRWKLDVLREINEDNS